jgi:hypothetical protein
VVVWDHRAVSPILPGGLFPNGKIPLTPADWFRTADHLTRSPTRLLVDLIEAVAAHVADDDLAIQSGDTTVVLRLVDLQVDHPEPQAFLGALDPAGQTIDRIDLEVRRVHWEDGGGNDRIIDDIAIRVADARVEPGRNLTLVAGPIEAIATLRAATVQQWLAASDLEYHLELSGPGELTARPKGRSWMRAKVRPYVEGDTVHLPISRVGCWGIELPVPPKWQGERSAGLPGLARGARITDVEVGEDELRLHVRIEQLREPIPLEKLQRALLRAGSRLVLSVADPR